MQNMSNCLIDQESKLFHVNDFQTIPNICLSPDGTFGLVIKSEKHYISRFCLKSGKETNFAGIPDEPGLQNGPKEQALFNRPQSITFSPNGKFVLVVSTTNHCIRMICVMTGNVSTFVVLPTSYRMLLFSRSIFSPDGKFVFVCNIPNAYIIRICVKTRKYLNFAGDPGCSGSRIGPKEQALFCQPRGLTLSPDGTYLLVCDSNCCIRKICLLSGQVSTFAGIPEVSGCPNGPKKQATFNLPKSLTFSPDGTYLLVCDSRNHCIRKICLLSGQVSTFAGIPGIDGTRNGPKEQALFIFPTNLTFTKNGKVIIIQELNNCRYIKIKN